MIEKAALKIVDFISDYISMDDELAEVYKYGVEITISTILNMLITMIISLFLGEPLCGVIFLVCLGVIRSYCGGYHADSYFKCNCMMVILFSTAYCVSKFLVYFDVLEFWIMSSVLMISFIPLYAFSPVKNEHKTLSEKKAKKCRIISFVLYILVSMIGLLLITVAPLYGSIIIVTLVEISVMILVEIYRQRRKDNEA